MSFRCLCRVISLFILPLICNQEFGRKKNVFRSTMFYTGIMYKVNSPFWYFWMSRWYACIQWGWNESFRSWRYQGEKNCILKLGTRYLFCFDEKLFYCVFFFFIKEITDILNYIVYWYLFRLWKPLVFELYVFNRVLWSGVSMHLYDCIENVTGFLILISILRKHFCKIFSGFFNFDFLYYESISVCLHVPASLSEYSGL